MLSAVREVEVAVAIDRWTVGDARGGAWGQWGRSPWPGGGGPGNNPCGVCSGAVLANLRQEQRVPQKVGLLQERRRAPKIKEPTEPTRAMRCAGSNI